MLIRQFKKSDLDRIMKIWLQSNLDAHPFVDSSYWFSHEGEVREQISQAQIYICELEGQIIGFAGLCKDYLAGLFVDGKFRNRNAGHLLMGAVKMEHSSLTLSVYEINKKAIRFYLREGLQVTGARMDEDTGQKELIMAYGAPSFG